MLVLLSPAKSLDFASPIDDSRATQPAFLDDAEVLTRRARRLSAKKLQELMHISDALAKENAQRFKDWSRPFTRGNARPAIHAFTGDVYQGFKVETLEAAGLEWAQGHVRILSGLHGLLRPMDLIQPYRLEMGLKFPVARKKNLYEYWGSRITEEINAAVEASGSKAVVNLASNEYFKAVKPKELSVPLISPAFRESKDGALKMISFSAKRARGALTRYIVDQRLTSPEQLLAFTEDRYRLRKSESTASSPLFTRKFIPVKA